MDVLLCDMADEVAKLQYALFRAAPDVSIEVATDPFEAVEAAMRARPGVIVCALDLPDVGGIEFLRRLRAVAPGTPVVARGGSAAPGTSFALTARRPSSPRSGRPAMAPPSSPRAPPHPSAPRSTA